MYPFAQRQRQRADDEEYDKRARFIYVRIQYNTTYIYPNPNFMNIYGCPTLLEHERAMHARADCVTQWSLNSPMHVRRYSREHRALYLATTAPFIPRSSSITPSNHSLIVQHRRRRRLCASRSSNDSLAATLSSNSKHFPPTTPLPYPPTTPISHNTALVISFMFAPSHRSTDLLHCGNTRLSPGKSRYWTHSKWGK